MVSPVATLRRWFLDVNVAIASVLLTVIYFVVPVVPYPGYALRFLYGQLYSAFFTWDETLVFAGELLFVYLLAVVTAAFTRYLRARFGADSRPRTPFTDLAFPGAAVVVLVGTVWLLVPLLFFQTPNTFLLGVGVVLLLFGGGILRYIAYYVPGEPGESVLPPSDG